MTSRQFCRPGPDIPIDKNSELGKLLDEARQSGNFVVLEVNGHSYRLLPQSPPPEDPWKGYDPARVRAALEKTAGSWANLDTDTVIAKIYRAREEGSRPADRP